MEDDIPMARTWEDPQNPGTIPGCDDPIVMAAYLAREEGMWRGCWTQDNDRVMGWLDLLGGLPSIRMSEHDRCILSWSSPTHTVYEVRRYLRRHDMRTMTLYGLPETVANALEGRRLSDVVTMPGADRMLIHSMTHTVAGLPGSVASAGSTHLALRIAQ